MNLSIINNLSARAYTLSPPDFASHIHWCSPAESFRLFMNRSADASLIPTACLAEIHSCALPIEAYGIACSQRARSVLLFCREPLEQIIRLKRPVYCTPDSRTARMLFRVLCTMTHHTVPKIIDCEENAGAFLLIGDGAMTRLGMAEPWAEILDLGLWWHNLTGVPFVFAQWVMHRDLPRSKVQAITDWLETCATLSESLTGKNQLASVEIARGHFSASPREAHEYYDAMHIRLSDEDLIGLNLFLKTIQGIEPC